VGASVVAGSDAPPVLEFAEHVLDPVPLSVERPVVWYLDFPVGFRGDAGLDLPVGEGIAKPVGVVAFVGQQHLGGGHGPQQGCGTGVVADLACRKEQAAWAAFAVADRVQFRVQAALGAAYMPGKSPFLSRLAAVRCAFRWVASIMSSSVSPPPPASSTKIRPNMPNSLQRMKRL
jgi:hypothetical protein